MDRRARRPAVASFVRGPGFAQRAGKSKRTKQASFLSSDTRIGPAVRAGVSGAACRCETHLLDGRRGATGKGPCHIEKFFSVRQHWLPRYPPPRSRRTPGNGRSTASWWRDFGSIKRFRRSAPALPSSRPRTSKRSVSVSRSTLWPQLPASRSIRTAASAALPACEFAAPAASRRSFSWTGCR